MSNIGKQRILIPPNVNIKSIGWKLVLSGTHGSFSIILPEHTKVVLQNNSLRLLNFHINPALYGSLQRKIKAKIESLSLESVTLLQFVGANYRARIEKDIIIIRLGYSHEINVAIPKNLNVTVIKRNNIRISGLNFEDVRQYAYKLRSFRPPEPFKGKGVVCVGEVVRRKEGKKKKL